MRKKVKKRLLSLLLCGAMVFSLCPPAAAAVKDAEYDDPKILAQTGTREAEGEAGSLAWHQRRMQIIRCLLQMKKV